MITVNEFKSVLWMLPGVVDVNLKENERFNFYTVTAEVLGKSQQINYVWIKKPSAIRGHFDDLLEALNSTLRLKDYDIVLNGNVVREDMSASQIQMLKALPGVTEVLTPGDLLIKYFLGKQIGARLEPGPENDIFIEPDILLPKNIVEPNASQYIGKWLVPETVLTVGRRRDPAHIGVVIADGGCGKTTVMRRVERQLSQRKTKPIVPLLVESETWRGVISKDVDIDNLWRRCVNQKLDISTDKMDLSPLFQEKVFIPIFDGFDEYCLSASQNYSAVELLRQLMQMAHPDGYEEPDMRMLITMRKNFWEVLQKSLTPDELSAITIFELSTFNSSKIVRYFSQRFPEDPYKQNAAEKWIRDLSAVQLEKLASKPAVLAMIADIVDRDGASSSASSYGELEEIELKKDPVYVILKKFCDREIGRDKIPPTMTPADQIRMMTEMWTEHPDGVDDELLRTFFDNACASVDVALRDKYFATYKVDYGLFDRVPNSQGGIKYVPKYGGNLLHYFLAKYVTDVISDDSALDPLRLRAGKTLSKSNLGPTEVTDHLTDALLRVADLSDQRRVFNNIRRTADLVEKSGTPGCEKERNEILSAAFHIVAAMRTRKHLDKKEGREFVLALLGRTEQAPTRGRFGILEGISMSGTIEDFSFADIEFRNRSLFSNVVFHGCDFSDTRFNDATFAEDLKFENCSGHVSLDPRCMLSDAARYAFRETFKKFDSPAFKIDYAKKALSIALAMFPFAMGRFRARPFAQRSQGPMARIPKSENVWSVLLDCGVVVRNREKGKDELLIAPECQADVRNYLDNRICSQKIQEVLTAIERQV